MKRRNVELAKMRRPIKRNKISEGFYGSSTVLYIKFLLLWILVIVADFLLEFRFEFLWPFYLLLRSIYDSFKMHGLAFSVFFMLIALTSDMLCYFFIPVHWLFFAASTYVWVQYVWHMDKGICAPTIVLWVLFVYLEAAVRLRDVKHMPGHLDLCRPFAAHCIGYPIVTLGFNCKNKLSNKIRQQRQRIVAKENKFYMQLMQQALPTETSAKTDQSGQTVGSIAPVPTVQSSNKLHNNKQEKNGHVPNGTVPNGISHANHGSKSHKKSEKSKNDHANDQHDHPKHSDKHIERQKLSHAHSNGSAVGSEETTATAESESSRPAGRRRERREQDRDREVQEYLQRLEADVRRVRADLHQSRSSEQELRLQVASLTTSEKVTKGELSTTQRQVEELQERLQSVNAQKASDRQTIGQLERRVAEERRLRAAAEQQLGQERKNRKQEEARLAQQVAAQQSSRSDCTDQCRARRRELETELAELRQTRRWADERCTALERENAALADQLRDTDILMSALSAMQEKNTHLENSLSAENRVKLDLFSALGEAKRQLEIRENSNRAHEKEIEELKGKIAQVLAVMPTDSFGGPPSPPGPVTPVSRVRLAESPPNSTLSKLDPNATAYTPKGSLVASTEA